MLTAGAILTLVLCAGDGCQGFLSAPASWTPRGELLKLLYCSCRGSSVM